MGTVDTQFLFEFGYQYIWFCVVVIIMLLLRTALRHLVKSIFSF